jgi:hypothetical protein
MCNESTFCGNDKCISYSIEIVDHEKNNCFFHSDVTICDEYKKNEELTASDAFKELNEK